MSAIRQPAPQQKRWTKDEYYRLAEMGFFQGQRVELIEGELMVASPQRGPHALAIEAADEALRAVFGPGFRVRCQLPLDLGATTEPEPDLAVVAGTRRQAGPDHPSTAVLIVEVSDTSLDYDRGRKASLYARVGIPDYWVVNLVDAQVEVYRVPAPDATAPFGHSYASREVFGRTGTLSPLAVPGGQVAVAELLA